MLTTFLGNGNVSADRQPLTRNRNSTLSKNNNNNNNNKVGDITKLKLEHIA